MKTVYDYSHRELTSKHKANNIERELWRRYELIFRRQVEPLYADILHDLLGPELLPLVEKLIEVHKR